jgi:hypothetical protein
MTVRARARTIPDSGGFLESVSDEAHDLCAFVTPPYHSMMSPMVAPLARHSNTILMGKQVFSPPQSQSVHQAAKNSTNAGARVLGLTMCV